MQYLEKVIDCIANTTRYPKEILTPTSDLENDLGIDSVKRLEITLAIGEAFNIPAEHQTREPWVRTIQDVATWVSQVASTPAVPPPAVTTPAIPLPAIPLPAVANPTIAPSQPIARIELPALTKPSPAPVAHRVDERASLPTPHSVSPAPTAESSQAKVAFITGAGHGVGNVIARLLAQQGITVIVNTFHSRLQGEQTVHEIRQAGGNAVHIWGSVANPTHVESMFDQIESLFGKLDYLICNASDGKIGSFLELNSEDWDRAFRTNVSGHYQCAIKASRLMQVAGGGRIVTLSSVGSHSYIRDLGSQGVVKAAVETMTRYLACELGPMGIRVNCVAGGPVYGDLLNKFPNAALAQRHWETMTPDGELCNPLDLANAILFLLGDSARGMNGSVIQVDHGFSAVADGRPSHVPTVAGNRGAPFPLSSITSV